MVPLRVREAGRAVDSGFPSAQLFASIDGGGALRRMLATASPPWRTEMARSKKRRVIAALEEAGPIASIGRRRSPSLAINLRRGALQRECT